MYERDCNDFEMCINFQSLKMGKVVYDCGKNFNWMNNINDLYFPEAFIECIEAVADLLSWRWLDDGSKIIFILRDSRIEMFYRTLSEYEEKFGKEKADKYVYTLEKNVLPYLDMHSYDYEWALRCNRKNNITDRLVILIWLDEFIFYGDVLEGIVKLLGWYRESAAAMRKEMTCKESRVIV